MLYSGFVDDYSKVIKKIEIVRSKIAKINLILPGSISEQIRGGDYPKKIHQLNCRVGGKKRTVHISENFVESANAQIENFQTYEKLTKELHELSLERAVLEMKRGR